LFVLQLALADLPELEGFPSSGLLSFFVANWEDYGEECHVRWTSSTEGLSRREPPGSPPELTPYGDRMQREGASLTGRPHRSLPDGNCEEAQEAIDRHAHGMDKDASDEIAEEIWEWLETEVDPPPHFFGGYPRFTQFDSRGDADECVLLHLGWDPAAPREWAVCWGDAGDANFFCSEAQLQDRQFDRIRFYWDCG
ncbi:MAG: DUF1963 domain-containing protein, partial [Planctomycetota bacterium]